MSDDSLPPEPPIEPTGADGTPPPPPTEPPIEPTGADGTPPPPTEPMPVTDPNEAIPGDDPEASPPWYQNRGAVAAIIALGLLLIFLLVGWLVWWSDDDDDDVDETLGTAVIVDSSTLPDATTIPDGSIVDAVTVPTIEVTVPPSTTTPPTTAPATTVPDTAPATTVPDTAPATTVPDTAPATTAPPAGGAPDVTVPPGGGSLVDILSGNPDLSIVWQLVQDAGLADVLATSANENTIFAPANSAFDGVTPPTGPALATLILQHVVPLSLDSTAVFAETSLPTLGGPSLAVDAGAGTVGGAQVVVPDLQGTTPPVGYIHVVDALLTGS